MPEMVFEVPRCGYWHADPSFRRCSHPRSRWRVIAVDSVRAPAAYNGVLDRKRDAHFFTLDVRAGERLVFDVDGMKLGYLLDPIVAIYSLDGDLIAFDDDRLQQNGKQ